jgi:aspartate beta-hydroxylase
MQQESDQALLTTLIQKLDNQFHQGNIKEAIDLASKIEQISPSHPYIYNFHALLYMRSADYVSAEKFFKLAIQSPIKFPIIYANYSRMLRQTGNLIASLSAIDEALKIDQAIYALHFEKASIYEEMGLRRQAALSYQNALNSTPPQVKDNINMSKRIEHAQTVAKQNLNEFASFIETRIGPINEFHSTSTELARFGECINAMLGRIRIQTQKPQMLHFPELPAISFYDPGTFSWVPKFESYYEAILSELNNIINTDNTGFQPYVKTDTDQAAGVFEPLRDNINWGAYFLYNQGNRVVDHCEKCPNTLAALQHAPIVAIKNRAPTSFFSSLLPNTHIPPHYGATNTRLTVHLPLLIPHKCGIRVGNSLRQWEPGKIMIFDDTIEHEAWNFSDQRRIVFIFDVWNPYLSKVEIELVSKTVEAIVDYYGDGALLGEL